MKNSCNIITAALCAALLTGAATGCDIFGNDRPPKEEGKEWVRMTGVLPVQGARTGYSRAELVTGPIDPVGGLPPRQLDVAIVTVNHVTADPALDQPGYTQWAGHEAETTRGFFGSDDSNGVLSPGTAPTNGHIEYVNESGDYIQRVFYPEEPDEYYYVRVAYPWQGFDQFIQMPDNTGAALVFSNLTGHEDILCSNLGWGSQAQPVIETDCTIPNPALDPESLYSVDPYTPDYDPDDYPTHVSVLKFSHALAQLRFWVVAENERAKEQYGDIKKIVVRFQPDKIALRMIDAQTMRAQDAVDRDYLSDFFIIDTLSNSAIEIYNPDYVPAEHGNIPQGTSAGRVMVMPDYTFRIEAETSLRKWIGADYEFKVDGDVGKILPGHIYDVTLKFMEAYKLAIEMTDAGEWWMDSVFD